MGSKHDNSFTLDEAVDDWIQDILVAVTHVENGFFD